MKPNEIPMRLGYINVTLKGFTHEPSEPLKITEEEIMDMYHRARSMAEQPLSRIIKNATKKYGENVSSLFRCENDYGAYDLVPISKLCFDESHESLPLFRGQSIKRGELLTDFYKSNEENLEIKESVGFIERHKDFFNKYIPITVRKYGDKFEVIDGNHRAFCAIKHNEEYIPALVVSKEKPENPETDLDFILP